MLSLRPPVHGASTAMPVSTRRCDRVEARRISDSPMNRTTAIPSDRADEPEFGDAPTATEAGLGALPPGAWLDEYELRTVLDEGRRSIRYVATDHALQRDVVVREYLPAGLACRGATAEVRPIAEDCAEAFARGLRDFVDEARLLASLEDPALPRVFRAWEANGTAYMAMTHVEGVGLDLARAAMARPPDEAWLRGLLIPLLDALEQLHASGRFDWDISPHSILLLPDGRPMLCGSDDGPQSGAGPERTVPMLPAPAYAPIERQAEMTQLQQGPWTSLYSIAAVAYYCIAGRPPLAATVRAVDDPLEPLFAVVDRLGRQFPEVTYSVALVSTIERALRVRPQERPQSVAEFRQALLGGRGATAQPATQQSSHWDEPAVSRYGFTGPTSFGDWPPLAQGSVAEDAFRTAPDPWPPAIDPRPEPYSDSTVAHATDIGRAAAAEPSPLADPAASGGVANTPAPRADAAGPGGFRAEGGSRRTGGGRRYLFLGLGAAVFVALAVGGASIWLDLRDASLVRRSTTQGGVPAPPVVAVAPAASGASSLPTGPMGAADGLSSVPSSATPTGVDPVPPATPTGLAAAPSAMAGAVAPAVDPTPGEAPTEGLPDPSPATGEPAPPPPPAAEVAVEQVESPVVAAVEEPVEAETTGSATAEVANPPPPKVVQRAIDNPRELCAPRTRFALYRCMTLECERPRFYDHPECRYLRATDEVRPLQ